MANTIALKQTQIYELFHSLDDFFNMALQYARRKETVLLQEAFGQHYCHVHSFRLPADEVDGRLEEIVYKSQNVNRSWRRRSPCRSTSVGDIVRVGSDYWVVADVGFYLAWSD